MFSKALYERKLRAVYLEGEGADPPPQQFNFFKKVSRHPVATVPGVTKALFTLV